MTKNEIRQGITRKRNRLSKKWISEKSAVIEDRLTDTVEFERAKTVMFYIAKDGEVDTVHMIERAVKNGKVVCAPCVDRESKTIKPAIIRDLDKDLIDGCFGIKEPCDKGNCPKDIDLIIVPGIAFNRDGYRIGWGKGYYDRFLKQAGGIPMIGLAFSFQIVENMPVDGHDVPVCKVLTERFVIETRK